MAEFWADLRSAVAGHDIGQTFKNELLGSSPQLADALDDGCKVERGGTLFFDDSPENIVGSVKLNSDQTLLNTNFNGILFTDIQPLLAGHKYRYFVHHLNKSGGDRRISVRLVNHGPSPSALVQKNFEHVEVGNVASAAERLTRAMLKPIQGGALAFTNPDTILGSQVIGAPSVPKFNNSSANVVDLVSRLVPHGKLITGVIEFTVQQPGVRIYGVVGDPPASAYTGDNLTALQQDIHGRGTFPNDVVTRFVPGQFRIETGVEKPGVLWLVGREGPIPRDTDWAGEDRCLSDAQAGQDAGNYGRLHFMQITFVSSALGGRNVAIVANPRTPHLTTKFFGYVRDVGANKDVRVAAPGGEDNSGTVIWKGSVTSAGPVTKRLVYTTTGASAGKLNIWIIPF